MSDGWLYGLNVAGATYGKRRREEKEKRLEALRRKQETEFQYDLQRRNQLALEQTKQVVKDIKEKRDAEKAQLSESHLFTKERLDKLMEHGEELTPEAFGNVQKMVEGLQEARISQIPYESPFDYGDMGIRDLDEIEREQVASEAAKLASKEAADRATAERAAAGEARAAAGAGRAAAGEERTVAAGGEKVKAYEWEGRQYIGRDEFKKEVYAEIKKDLDYYSAKGYKPQVGDVEKKTKLEKNLEKAKDVLFGTPKEKPKSATRRFLIMLNKNPTRLREFLDGKSDEDTLRRMGVDVEIAKEILQADIIPPEK